ncbi:MAG TPA: 4a-hydroxytetrahydrobiopterin dehydratase [Capillimicrobium sp.]|jgi:4a-hydroxytetrahydrobiopterin dehydratase
MAWREDGEALVQDYEFQDFAGAMSFVEKVAQLAELQGHHPDILIHGWNNVRLTLSTHTQGRVTELDRDLATKIDEL